MKLGKLGKLGKKMMKHESETGNENIPRIKHQGENQITNMNGDIKCFSIMIERFSDFEIDFIITNINREKIFGFEINHIQLADIPNLAIIKFLEQKQFGNVGRILSDNIIQILKKAK